VLLRWSFRQTVAGDATECEQRIALGLPSSARKRSAEEEWPAPAKSPRFSSSFAVVLSDGLAIETTYGLSIVSEGRPIAVRSVEEKLVHKKFPGKTPEIPLGEIPWDREAMKRMAIRQGTE
jgi:hypothetical protein